MIKKVVWADSKKNTGYISLMDILKEVIKRDIEDENFSSAKEWCDMIESGEWEEMSDEDKLIFLAESPNILSITI